jgi:hypothetical protein
MENLAMKRSLRLRLCRVGPMLLCLSLLCAAFASSAASFFLSVNFAPPPIPVYEQPLCPGPGYIWVPGYWAWGPNGYYWVPGTWVVAPFVGALWTPGYWGWNGTVYVWHPGYWGTHVGFYGGIDYGFGYFGTGYTGGYWDHGTFYYNAAVDHVDTRIVHHVYRRNVVHAANGPRASYNGGRGGTAARPTAAQLAAAREVHRSATPMQLQQERLARNDRTLRASVNHGAPTIAATRRPAQFERSVARGAAPAGRAAPGHRAHAPGGAPQARAFARPAGSEGRHVAPPIVSRSNGFEHRGPNAALASPALQQRPAERGYPQANVRGARPQPMRPPEMRARNMQRPPASRPMLAMPRQPMRPEGTARPHGPAPQAMPRPQMHAQNMPRPQARPHGGRGGGREERRRG